MNDGPNSIMWKSKLLSFWFIRYLAISLLNHEIFK
jgi:hypothetical protein